MSFDKITQALDDVAVNQAEIRDRMLNLEQRATAAPGESMNKSASLGDQFVKAFDVNRELFEKTRSVRLQIKAAGDAVTTANGRTIVSGGVGGPAANLLGLQYALTTTPASGQTAIEYSRYIGQQGAAAIQAGEGAGKAAVRPDHELIVQSSLTVAGHTKMSRQAMSDSAELRRSIDTTLSRSVNSALDVALTTGGTGFAGGFTALATTHTSTAYPALLDAISEACAVMQIAGFTPNVVSLNPMDWLAITVMKSAAGEYLNGAYLAAMPAGLRGLRVVLSPTVAVGTALLIDSAHAELCVVDDFTVEVAYVNDDFTRNLCTILGEMRVIPVFRSVGAMVLVTPAA